MAAQASPQPAAAAEAGAAAAAAANAQEAAAAPVFSGWDPVIQSRARAGMAPVGRTPLSPSRPSSQSHAPGLPFHLQLMSIPCIPGAWAWGVFEWIVLRSVQIMYSWLLLKSLSAQLAQTIKMDTGHRAVSPVRVWESLHC